MIPDDTNFYAADYFKPKSVTWWSGIALMLVGVLQILGVVDGNWEQTMAIGTGLVGIRAKLGRI